MKKKWICTIAEDIGCPERTADGFCRIENCRCSFRTENENTLESEQKSGYVRKEKWFEKYYK